MNNLAEAKDFCRRVLKLKFKGDAPNEIDKKILVNGEQISDPAMIRFTEACMDNIKSLKIENEGTMKLNGKLKNKIDNFEAGEEELKERISELEESQAGDRQLIVDLNKELRKMSRYVESKRKTR